MCSLFSLKTLNRNHHVPCRQVLSLQDLLHDVRFFSRKNMCAREICGFFSLDTAVRDQTYNPLGETNGWGDPVDLSDQQQ